MLFDVSVPTRMRSVGCDFTVRKRATPVQLAWALDGTLVNVTAYNASTKISIAAYPTPSERTWSTDFMTLNTSPTANTYYMFHWTASAEI